MKSNTLKIEILLQELFIAKSLGFAFGSFYGNSPGDLHMLSKLVWILMNGFFLNRTYFQSNWERTYKMRNLIRNLLLGDSSFSRKWF